MKKLTITLAILLGLLTGTPASADDCGHQHAERCLVSSTVDLKKVDEIELTEKLKLVVTSFLRFKIPF